MIVLYVGFFTFGSGNALPVFHRFRLVVVLCRDIT